MPTRLLLKYSRLPPVLKYISHWTGSLVPSLTRVTAYAGRSPDPENYMTSSETPLHERVSPCRLNPGYLYLLPMTGIKDSDAAPIT